MIDPEDRERCWLYYIIHGITNTIQERRTELHKKCAKSITDSKIEELIVCHFI